jgi:hypothetical protein
MFMVPGGTFRSADTPAATVAPFSVAQPTSVVGGAFSGAGAGSSAPSFMAPSQPSQPSFMVPSQLSQPSFMVPSQPSFMVPSQPSQPSFMVPSQPSQPSFMVPSQPSFMVPSAAPLTPSNGAFMEDVSLTGYERRDGSRPPHALVSFGFGGKLVTMFPRKRVSFAGAPRPGNTSAPEEGGPPRKV